MSLFKNSSTVSIFGNRIYIDGEKLPEAPQKRGGNNTTTINGKVFVNGYEYKNGAWVRTLRALWHLWF